MGGITPVYGDLVMSKDENPRSRAAHRRALSVGFGMASLFLMVSGVAGAEGSKASAPACIGYWGEARFRGYGYYHVVHVANDCARAAVCDVSTDVNPTPERVTVPAKQQVEVVTFQGSPAREFVPHVECKLGGS
jgi:hypothetical protein